MKLIIGPRAAWLAHYSVVRQTSKREVIRAEMINSFLNLRKLQNQIHAEIEEEMARVIEADDVLNGFARRGIDNQEFIFDLSKYLTEGFKVRKGCEQEPESLNTHDPEQVEKNHAGLSESTFDPTAHTRNGKAFIFNKV